MGTYTLPSTSRRPKYMFFANALPPASLRQFNASQSVGIGCIANPLARAHRTPEQPPEAGEKYQIRARKYVVESAGALGTPLLLERSGLGDEVIL